jgi:hypothetical protein
MARGLINRKEKGMKKSSCIKKTTSGKQRRNSGCDKAYGTKAQETPVTCGKCDFGYKSGRKISCGRLGDKKLLGKENDRNFSCGHGILKPSFDPHQLMKIHESLERIRKGKLTDMCLFELSIRSPMQTDVYREIRNRLMLAQASLEVGDAKAAKAIVDKLLEGPQERGRA